MKQSVKRRILEDVGRLYESGEVGQEPELLQPHRIDEELREACPRCCAHYDRLNGLRYHAERYFLEKGYSDDPTEIAPRQRDLIDAIETVRAATTTEAVATEAEVCFAESDVELLRAITAQVAERAQATSITIANGLSVSDAVFSLRAEMNAAQELFELVLSFSDRPVFA